MIKLKLSGQNISIMLLEDSDDSTCIEFLPRDRSCSLSSVDPAPLLPPLVASGSYEGSTLLVTESQEKSLTIISNKVEVESS